LFKPEVALNVGGGHFSGFGMGFTAPVSLGGSWSFRQRAGIGVRFDVSRTLAESRHVVECVRDLSGRCAGSGEEGVNKIFIGTAQVTYHFRDWAARGTSAEAWRPHSVVGALPGRCPDGR
jgi:hypothetical protein